VRWRSGTKKKVACAQLCHYFHIHKFIQAVCLYLINHCTLGSSCINIAFYKVLLIPVNNRVGHWLFYSLPFCSSLFFAHFKRANGSDLLTRSLQKEQKGVARSLTLYKKSKRVTCFLKKSEEQMKDRKI